MGRRGLGALFASQLLIDVFQIPPHPRTRCLAVPTVDADEVFVFLCAGGRPSGGGGWGRAGAVAILLGSFFLKVLVGPLISHTHHTMYNS
jgi:hypothetical protein